MHVRRMKTWLHLATGVLLLAAVGALFGCLFWPLAEPIEARQEGAGRKGPRRVEKQPPPMPSLEQFAKVWNKPLQRPLFDPKAESKAVADRTKRKAASPFDVELVATMVDSKYSLAMFVVSKKKIQVKSVGETLDGISDKAEVLSIKPNRVVVRYRGKEIALVSDEKEGG